MSNSVEFTLNALLFSSTSKFTELVCKTESKDITPAFSKNRLHVPNTNGTKKRRVSKYTKRIIAFDYVFSELEVMT